MNEDPLFNENNAVKFSRKTRNSTYYGNSMPGGKMRWYLLKEGKCPRCGYMLEADADERRLMFCENPHCSFAITDIRMKAMVDDMLDRSQDENFNQGLLNNI